MCIEYKDKYECVDYRAYIMGTDKHPCPCDKCCFNKNMSKAEQFIQDYTRNCSNEMAFENEDGSKLYRAWLTPDDAKSAVEIAREEAIEQTVNWLKKHAIKYYTNSNGFLGTDELVEDYKLIMSMKDE